jgi:AcrR family transcriptional regulator
MKASLDRAVRYRTIRPNVFRNAGHKLPDRRIRKTRKALQDALLTLAGARAWDDISVQDICSAADVGRSTFYAHYEGKEALLEGGLQEFSQTLYAATSLSGEPFAYVPRLIEHVHDQRRVFRSIIGRRSGHVAQMRFREMLLDLAGRDLTSRIRNTADRDVAVHCVAGALFEVLVLACEKSRAIDPVAVCRRLTLLADCGQQASH